MAKLDRHQVNDLFDLLRTYSLNFTRSVSPVEYDYLSRRFRLTKRQVEQAEIRFAKFMKKVYRSYAQTAVSTKGRLAAK